MKQAESSRLATTATPHRSALAHPVANPKLDPEPQEITSLYVHVPFCSRKCDYCAFYSEASDGQLINRYIKALIRELEVIASDLRPRTIFFGGGTPSLLNARQWAEILEAMQRLDLLGAEEWTVECNPATVSLEKARLLKSFGVNRLSMGVQSLNEDLLDRLGRVHSREMAFKSFDILRKAGFENLNLDLMFAIPGQTLSVWRDTLREAVAMGSEHLSSYEVIYEEDTPLYRQMHAREFDVDEDLACAMYEELVDHATRAGFIHYEVANFARERVDDGNVAPAENWEHSYACRHNVNYWRGGSFYGLGPSATRYIRGKRVKNWSNTQMYCDLIEQGRSAAESVEQLNPLARAGETAAFGLRMVEGWPYEVFRSVTGFDLTNEWAQDIESLVQRGWGRSDPGHFCLTPQGLRFADSAAQLFLR